MLPSYGHMSHFPPQLFPGSKIFLTFTSIAQLCTYHLKISQIDGRRLNGRETPHTCQSFQPSNDFF